MTLTIKELTVDEELGGEVRRFQHARLEAAAKDPLLCLG